MIYVYYKRDDGYTGDCIDGQLEPCEGYDDAYHHSRIVEALKAENESLKSAVSILGKKLRDVNKAHDRAEDKLEKAIKAVEELG